MRSASIQNTIFSEKLNETDLGFLSSSSTITYSTYYSIPIGILSIDLKFDGLIYSEESSFFTSVYLLFFLIYSTGLTFSNNSSAYISESLLISILEDFFCIFSLSILPVLLRTFSFARSLSAIFFNYSVLFEGFLDIDNNNQYYYI